MSDLVKFFIGIADELKLEKNSVIRSFCEEIDKNENNLRLVMIMLLPELSNRGRKDLKYSIVMKAREVLPDSYYQELAECYHYGFGVEKDIDRAISMYKELIKERPRDSKILYTLGDIYKDIDINESLEWFEKGAKTMGYTYSCMCYYELGHYYYTIGNNDKAKKYLEFAVRYLDNKKCKELLDKINNK